MVQHRRRDVRRRARALFVHTRSRAGKCSKRFNRSSRATRKIPQTATLLRRAMDHNQRGDI